MKPKLLLLFFFLLGYFNVNAQVCTLTATTGDWEVASTWTAVPSGCATVPGNNCIIIIPNGVTVTVTTVTAEYVNMEIYVFGTLHFNSGKKIRMCSGYLKVFDPNGVMEGDATGSKLEICNVFVWTGATTVTTLTEFGGGTTLLPIELTRFTANPCEKEVCIDWTTLSEMNNDFFTIEKSKNGSSFETAGIIDGAGNSTVIRNYSFVDNNPYNDVSYYRLKQTDFNGDFSYSKLEMVDLNSMNDFTINVFPNPNDGDNISISIKANLGEEILVVAYDGMCREVYSKVLITTNDGENITAFDPSGKLSSGIYLITATSNQKICSKKMIVK